MTACRREIWNISLPSAESWSWSRGVQDHGDQINGCHLRADYKRHNHRQHQTYRRAHKKFKEGHVWQYTDLCLFQYWQIQHSWAYALRGRLWRYCRLFCFADRLFYTTHRFFHSLPGWRCFAAFSLILSNMPKKTSRSSFVIPYSISIIIRAIHERLAACGFDEVTVLHGHILGYLYHNSDRDIYPRDLVKEYEIDPPSQCHL